MRFIGSILFCLAFACLSKGEAAPEKSTWLDIAAQVDAPSIIGLVTEYAESDSEFDANPTTATPATQHFSFSPEYSYTPPRSRRGVCSNGIRAPPVIA